MPAIVRALTTRKVKMSLELAQEARERAAMQRSKTTKQTIGRTDSGRSHPSRSNSSATRPKISAPIELIHTTNMLSYNAPDLPRPSTSTSSRSSAKSVTHTDEESDRSPSTAASTPPTSPDVPSSELKRSTSPEPNHLSCYFMPPLPAQVSSNSPLASAPAIPQRAPSHTKQASIDRQRSISHMPKDSARSMSRGNYSFTRSASTATSFSSMSQDSVQTQSTGISSTGSYAPMSAPVEKMQYTPPPPSQHPFGLELAQVTEIAEEFGVSSKLEIIDEEEQELASRGLCKISADVYLNDIKNIASFFFHDRDATHARPAPAVWI